MLTGPKKVLSFQANTPSPLPPPPTLACNVLHGNVLQLQGEAKGYHMERNIEKKNKTHKRKTQTIIPNCKYLEYESVRHSNESYLR